MPGTSAQAYADALGAGLGQPYQVNANGSNSSQFFVIIGLIAMLTLLRPPWPRSACSTPSFCRPGSGCTTSACSRRWA